MSNVVPLVPPATHLIPEDQVTPLRLSYILSATYTDHLVEDEGDIYISDGVAFPLWLRVDVEAKLIVMFTYIEAESDAPASWLSKVNELNASIILPQFWYRDGCLWGRDWLTYDGGLSTRHLIKMLKRFAGAFRTAVEDVGLCPPNSSPKPDS